MAARAHAEYSSFLGADLKSGGPGRYLAKRPFGVTDYVSIMDKDGIADANGLTPRRTATREGRGDARPTRELILEAATIEFATKGIGGARVDEIAARSRANKRMIYHYFGDKQGLYLAVLERTYEEIRVAETQLQLKELEPRTALRKLIEFSFDYYTNHPHFIRLLDNENLHKARNLKRSTGIRQRNSPLVSMIGDLLKRGEAAGVFRSGIDPIQLYISIAGLGYFYFANIHTLSAIFGIDFATKEARAKRRQHVVDTILNSLAP
jgi:TetR/AcrR family transcriptional regulator